MNFVLFVASHCYCYSIAVAVLLLLLSGAAVADVYMMLVSGALGIVAGSGYWCSW